MPNDITVDSISDYQMAELNRLKEWLYRKRTRVREDRERAERRQKKEEETARISNSSRVVAYSIAISSI